MSLRSLTLRDTGQRREPHSQQQYRHHALRLRHAFLIDRASSLGARSWPRFLRPGSGRLLPQRVPPCFASPLSAFCRIACTFVINCLMSIPLNASNKAGTCAAIFVISPVILFTPAAPSPPVETTVILSTLASGSAIARTTSAMLVSSLSTTAAWFHS